MEILLENVRCFCDRQFIPIRPLTLLVGENSTGKTTLLAMLSYISQAEFPATRPSFNVEPFDLGSYDSIATFKGGRYGRAKSFSIGYSINGDKDTEGKKVIATYTSYKGQPLLNKFSATTDSDSFSLDLGEDFTFARVTIKHGSLNRNFTVDAKAFVEAGFPMAYFMQSAVLEQMRKTAELTDLSPNWLFNIIPGYRRELPPVFASAPVRTKPRRTYDELTDEFKPEGEHIPVQLARLWAEENDPERARVAEALNEFGTRSSLFKKIGVRWLGSRPSDPFQILVTTKGPAVNLLDVGYGVSQALPIIVESVLGNRRRRLLLQQPEVHLHPRGQAALGSFFASLVSKDQREFVIETHSDYIVDRLRMEVAQGNLRADDVLILFFDKEDLETQVHRLTLDNRGNILGAPDSYREFFLDEEMKIMSRTSR